MSSDDFAWLDKLRSRWLKPNPGRFLRPDAARFLRPDAHRYLRPDHARIDPLGALIRKYNADQPRVPAKKGAVANAQLNGSIIFGINSGAPGYTDADWNAALAWRDNLVQKYPDIMSTDNTGQIPNDALFHAEATMLLRAAKQNGGTLSGQYLEITVDREMCETSCPVVSPKLGMELGNPTVTYVGPNGTRRTMRNGKWLP